MDALFSPLFESNIWREPLGRSIFCTESDDRAMRNLFSSGEQGGYWPADPQYAYEDSAGTLAASVNGVVGLRLNAIAGYPNAVQATTGNKPYLRLAPTTNKPWYDSNTATGALNVTFASALGSACTIATVTPEGVSILENQTVGATYNITLPFGYNSDVLIINRALTAAEKALVTRIMQRSVPALGSELVTNGGFDTDMTGWAGWNLVNSPNNIIQSNGKGVFLIDGIGGAVSASLDIAVSANNAYFLTCYCHNSWLAVSDGKNYTYRFGAFEHDLNLQFKSIVPTQDYIRLYAYVPNNTAIQDVLYDNISLKAIL